MLSYTGSLRVCPVQNKHWKIYQRAWGQVNRRVGRRAMKMYKVELNRNLSQASHLMPQESNWTVTPVAIPNESYLRRLYEKPDLADAYTIRLPNNATTDPEAIARFLFSHRSPWFSLLMRLRDALVAPFGIKTSEQLQCSSGDHVGVFKIYEKGSYEIVLGEDDIHLDFRLSVLIQMKMHPYIVLSTVAHCHNLLGRIYIKLITPFHKMVVRSVLGQSARIGWPNSYSGHDDNNI